MCHRNSARLVNTLVLATASELAMDAATYVCSAFRDSDSIKRIVLYTVAERTTTPKIAFPKSVRHQAPFFLRRQLRHLIYAFL